MNLAYRLFCGLGLEDKVPHHSSFSVNRHGRFRDSDILRKIFEETVCGCMKAGLVGGEGFAHSRLRQLLLGGVTKHLLTSTLVPLFIAH